METALSLYKRPYDKAHPVVCMDESSKQHLKETRPPFPGSPASLSATIWNMNAPVLPVITLPQVACIVRMTPHIGASVNGGAQ